MIPHENNIFSNGKINKHYLNFSFESNNVYFYLLFGKGNKIFIDYGDGNVEEISDTDNQKIKISHSYINNQNEIAIKYDNHRIYGINVSNQKIKKIILNGSESLKYINGSNNMIKYVYLDKIKALNELILSNNLLEEIIIENTKLKYLDLSKNKISAINLEKIEDCNLIDLSNNTITTITLPEKSNTINLSNNNISDFSDVTYTEKSNFKEIDFSKNDLTAANIDIYSLESVNLSDNQLSSLSISSYNLRKIILKNNNISNFEISKNKNILFLDLRNNNITSFEYINKKIFDQNAHILLYCQKNYVNFDSYISLVNANILYDMNKAVKIAFKKINSILFNLKIILKIKNFSSENIYNEKISFFINNIFYGIDINYNGSISFATSNNSETFSFSTEYLNENIFLDITFNLANYFETILLNMKLTDNLLLDTFDIRENKNKINYFSNITFLNKVTDKLNSDIYLDIENVIKDNNYLKME